MPCSLTWLVEYLVTGSEHAVELPYAVIAGACSGSAGTLPQHGSTREDIDALDRGELSEVVLAGRYCLQRRLGRGGMGSVYLAQHLALGRPVAIKVLDVDERDWSWALAQFVREAQLAAKIRHQNVVDVYDFGSTPDGVVYIVMEMLAGRDLRAIVKCSRLNWTWTRYLMKQVCAGVEAIHRAGVVHRDLKAGNCFYVERNSVVKVLDFGIATTENTGRRRLLGRGCDADNERSVVGTPEYMAPEQIRGEPPDRRSDVYAAGVLLYELLAGRTPFSGYTAKAVFDRHLYAPPPCLNELVPELEVPIGLDAVLARALAKDPRRRFQSMLELSAALDRVGEASPLRRLFGARRAAALRPEDQSVFDGDAPTKRSRRMGSLESTAGSSNAGAVSTCAASA